MHETYEPSNKRFLIFNMSNCLNIQNSLNADPTTSVAAVLLTVHPRELMLVIMYMWPDTRHECQSLSAHDQIMVIFMLHSVTDNMLCDFNQPFQGSVMKEFCLISV